MLRFLNHMLKFQPTGMQTGAYKENHTSSSHINMDTKDAHFLRMSD